MSVSNYQSFVRRRCQSAIINHLHPLTLLATTRRVKSRLLADVRGGAVAHRLRDPALGNRRLAGYRPGNRRPRPVAAREGAERLLLVDSGAIKGQTFYLTLL